MFTLLQLHWGDLPFFNDTLQINQEYCNRHGYEYQGVPVSDEVDPYRRLYHRAPEVLKLLRPDNMVLYLDADAYVVDFSRKLEEVEKDYFQDERTVALFSENGFDRNRRWNAHEVNTGVFLIRHHEKTEPMLQAWWNAYEPAKAAVDTNSTNKLTDSQRHLALNDQAVFNRAVLPNFRDHINIAMNPYFGGVDGVFIRHQMLLDSEERVSRISRDRASLLA